MFLISQCYSFKFLVACCNLKHMLMIWYEHRQKGAKLNFFIMLCNTFQHIYSLCVCYSGSFVQMDLSKIALLLVLIISSRKRLCKSILGMYMVWIIRFALHGFVVELSVHILSLNVSKCSEVWMWKVLLHFKAQLLLTPTTVAGVKRLVASVCEFVCLSVCLCVCLHDNSTRVLQQHGSHAAALLSCYALTHLCMSPTGERRA